MKHYLVLFLVIVSQISCAQTHLPEIEGAYSKFEIDPQLKYGLSSLTVLNAETGKVIFSRSGNIGLAPASTLKTITSITAFHLLGYDFRWETSLGYSGSIANGTLNGDLIIMGSGDPSLGSDRFTQTKSQTILNRWVAAIKRAGIEKINGRIIGNDNLLGTQTLPPGWVWQDVGNYYGAGATSLNWKENEFGIKFSPGKVGEMANVLSTTIGESKIKLVNEVKTGTAGSGDNVYAFSAPYTDLVYLRGSYGVDLKKTIMISMPDPALSLTNDLKRALTQSGIDVSGAATTSRLLDLDKETYTKPSTVLDIYSSPSLAQVVYWFNQKSINLYGESILKTIAFKQGKEGSTQKGVDEVQKFWKNKLGIDSDALAILDGSGLSPENRVTTLIMASILQSSLREPWYKSFYESLPLFNDMKMKSGSIRNVLGYTGYHKSSSGTPYVFTFITNNYNGSSSGIKKKMFKVLDELK